MRRNLPSSVPCRVCGDKSFGKHYGVYCCDGCSCFFKRSIRRNIVYSCVAGSQKCLIDKIRRNWCPYCRLMRCFAVKMNASAVQEERGPRRAKSNIAITSQEAKELTLQTERPNQYKEPLGPSLILPPECGRAFTGSFKSSFDFGNFHQSSNIIVKIVYDILEFAIREARCNLAFQNVPREDQNYILRKVWCELFVMRAANWPIDVLNFVPSRMRIAIFTFRNLCADLLERRLIETFIISKGDIYNGGGTCRTLEISASVALNALLRYFPPGRSTEILLTTRAIILQMHPKDLLPNCDVERVILNT